MNKKQLQDEEPRQVAGAGPEDTALKCPSCGKPHSKYTKYSNGGYLVEITSNGCFHYSTWHLKCPDCGYEWTD